MAPKLLSKSKLIAFRQCPRRLWLEVHKPELREDSAGSEARMEAGNELGRLARRLYDPDNKGTSGIFLSDIERYLKRLPCPSVVLLGGRAPAEIFGYVANRNFTAFPPCAPCARRTGCPHDMACMTALAPAAVADAVLALLAQPPSRPLTCATSSLS